MWPRLAEGIFALWLLISTFVFPHDAFFIANNLICFVLITLFALLCYKEELRKFHIFNILIGIWLIGVALLRSQPDILIQNSMIVGLFLLTFSLVPTQANLPPKSWRDFYDNQL